MIVKPAITFLIASADALLITMIRTILLAMTGNVNFDKPEPTLAMIGTALDDFITAFGKAADGGKELTAIKNAKRNELVSLVRQLASYVLVACHGDMAILLSSGFPVQKPNRQPIGVLPAPEAPKVSQGGRTGEMYAVTSPLSGGYIYTWQLFLASGSNVPVRTEQTTGARHTFTGLTRGATYRLQVNVIGTAGPSDWSQSVELMVL